jgi:hypothetical protein
MLPSECPTIPSRLELIRESGRPLAAPSANPFGQVSPTTAEHVRKSLGNKVDMILDGGPCAVGVESTIISFAEKDPVLLRPGGLSLEEIESIIGKVLVFQGSADKPMAPGQLLQHYSPRTPLRLISAGEIPAATAATGWLGLQNPPSGFAAVEVLSQKGDLKEAAANLFAAMRRLDDKNLDLIVAQPVPIRVWAGLLTIVYTGPVKNDKQFIKLFVIQSEAKDLLITCSRIIRHRRRIVALIRIVGLPRLSRLVRVKSSRSISVTLPIKQVERPVIEFQDNFQRPSIAGIRKLHALNSRGQINRVKGRRVRGVVKESVLGIGVNLDDPGPIRADIGL